MVVDGGEWLGSDGSGTADAETIVEYQTNGGQGEIVSVNTDDNTILLMSDNTGATAITAGSQRTKPPPTSMSLDRPSPTTHCSPLMLN